jgi:hypothetical protein
MDGVPNAKQPGYEFRSFEAYISESAFKLCMVKSAEGGVALAREEK